VIVVAVFLEEFDRPPDEELVPVVEIGDAGVVAVPGPDVVRLADVLDAVEAAVEA